MTDPMSHVEHRPAIETVLRRVPGFRGYLEKQYRRESDALERKFLCDRLQRSKRGLDDYARVLAEAGRLRELTAVDQVRPKLDHLMGRIGGAMQGYSGMFDLVQIDERLLERVYDFDAQLIGSVEALAGALEHLGDGGDASPDLKALVLKPLEEIQRAWDEREDILKGLK